MLKFIGLLMITFTFLVFNIMLAPTRDSAMNWRINSISFHIIIPLMYIVDWILFYERKTVKWYTPFVTVTAPLVYVIFIFIRAWSLGFNPDAPYIYPISS
ncbi:MAG: hypothetical protein E7462_04420 [Ruminococcaceae bacterium]|nr:hypothetical protein [Oscillospiraceae bacterium]